MQRKKSGIQARKKPPARRQPPRATSLGERAYKELERKIVTGALAPGDWITESEISASLGVSRTPVREALQRLSRARLIEIVPRRGLRVTAVNVSDQLVLLSFRRVVEQFIATSAARRASDADRVVFRRLATEIELTSKKESYSEHYRIDLEFKLHLLNCVHNDYAVSAIEPLWAASRRFAWATRHSRDIPRVAGLTATVMRAIASGDEKSTIKATMAFIACLEELTRKKLDEDNRL